MYLHKLSDFLRKRFQSKMTSPRPHNRMRLEQLEDRVVPSGIFTNTYTNATVQISPAVLGSVTLTVTANVTPFQGVNFSNGQITPIPSGATPPDGGRILFNLNNSMQTATVNNNGQATVSFTEPFLAFLASQTLTVEYLGFTDTSTGNSWEFSSFVAPLYMNFYNAVFNSTLTFAQLTPQQVYAAEISSINNTSSTNPGPTTLTPYNTAQGEKDTVGGNLFVFNYVDPGTISNFTVIGITLPGSFALQLGAYNGF